MKKRSIILRAAMAFLLLGFAAWPLSVAHAGEILRYSSSAQVREAFGMEGLNAFMAETGVELDLYVGSSGSAVSRLMNGFSNIASTTERLHFNHQAHGYVETLFCKAPLIVITNVQTPVRDISASQLRAIFNGSITNWKELGGPDKPIVVIVPEKNTGAYKNFRQLALRRFDVKYDFMAYRSTDVVKLVHRIPWSISFISRGAHTVDEAIKTIMIDGHAPEEKGYLYHQTFSFVTQGIPSGAAKKLIDFTFSDKGKAIMKKNGMEPIER